MTILVVALISLNIFLLAGVGVAYVRLREKKEDDPRMSYGLRMLQAKIAVLEDLSDKTDMQVQRLIQLLDQKMAGVKVVTQTADQQIKEIQEALQKALEVAEAFQSQVPIQALSERQDTNKYIKAARMSHSGSSVEEIQEQVDLPPAELELIKKVNSSELRFSEENLPAWAESSQEDDVFEVPQVSSESLDQIAEEFREACERFAKDETPS